MKFFEIAAIGFLVLGVGCHKSTVPLSSGRSSPIKVTETKDTLVNGVNLYKWHSTIIALQGLDDRSARCFLTNPDAASWTEVQLAGVPRGYSWFEPGVDQASDRVLFRQGFMENDQLVMSALVGRLSESITVRDITERKWLTDKKDLFGKNDPNVRLNEPGKRDWPQLGLGLINGQNLYIPYCLNGSVLTTFENGATSTELGPVCSGVFHSSDLGLNWQMEQISDSEAWLPSLCNTKGYYYYFAVKTFQRDLWFSRKPVEGNSWDAPKVLTKSFGSSALLWKYAAIAEVDRVHVCWLDQRHEKKRRNPVYPHRQNYEVVYSQRKDSDSKWSQDVILSEGMLYAFSPTMSVEGDNVVVAWAGVPTAPDWHSLVTPNDIYFRTSKDGGKTWGKLSKMTDGAKEGIISGDPQVMLLNGVIHLFYIQGKRDPHKSRSPWPVYYQQLPFPN